MDPPTPIYSWSDAYVALHRRTRESRGTITINPDTPAWERWPRTTGADVVAISAFLDPFVRGIGDRVGNLGVVRRWDACLADIGERALFALRDTYPGNREYWRCLAAVTVALSGEEVPLPEQRAWIPLFGLLGAVLRNANLGSPPFGPFPDAKEMDDVYMAQWKHLKETRGTDQMAPDPGTSGPTQPIPRATTADVIALADYWTEVLKSTRKESGHAELQARWDAALTDVNKARGAAPSDLYEKRNSFFRALDALAVQVSAVAATPPAASDWDRFVTAIGNSVSNLPENIGKAAEALASGVGHAAGAIGEGVGKVASEAGSGFFSGLKVPLLVSGGLLGAYLLLRKPTPAREA